MIATDSTISALWSRMKEYVRAYVSEYDRLDVATTEATGQVKPDGTTIDVDASGTISVIGASGPHWEVRTDADGNRRLAIVIPEVD